MPACVIGMYGMSTPNRNLKVSRALEGEDDHAWLWVKCYVREGWKEGQKKDGKSLKGDWKNLVKK